uniref:2Fe-2S ferredoxin-type domain-containing protein n=1 Tax=Cuerna arida TaxID=1464854 RepID=A0A1B6H3P3_9HEMI
MTSIFVKKCIWNSLSKITYKSRVLRSACTEELLEQFSFIGLVNSKPFFTSLRLKSQNEYKVTFIKANGDRITAKGKEGDSLLDVVVNNNLDFDGFGACEGTLTCSTCHCIFQQEIFDILPNNPVTEEQDMLDLAYGLTDTSRLGCQIRLSKDLDGAEVTLPATVNDARA